MSQIGSKPGVRIGLPLVMSVFLFARLLSSGRLEAIRTVDALSLFACGLTFGVFILRLAQKLRGETV